MAGAVLAVAVLTGATPAAGTEPVLARLGPITVSASALRAGPGGTLTTSVQLSTSAPVLGSARRGDRGRRDPVAVYHQQVNVGELPDLAGCGAETPSSAVVDRWLHYGPLLIPGRSGGPSPPAAAMLTVPAGLWPAGTTLAITLYFAHAGSVRLRLPVSRA